MTTYYAVTDINGQCSVELDATTLDEAKIEAMSEEVGEKLAEGWADLEDSGADAECVATVGGQEIAYSRMPSTFGGVEIYAADI